MGIVAGSTMDRLRRVKDPRRRQGKRYPLPGLLGATILAVMHGEKSLRGIWQWIQLHWEEIGDPLGLTGTKGAPAYGTLWGVMAGIDSEELNQALNLEGSEGETGYTVDGKQLRGSKRQSEGALQVVTVAGERYGKILAQRDVVAGNELAAAIRLLKDMPLEGQIVSMDAGLLQREMVKTITQKGGPISGR